jgi:hypothetical protein
MPINNDRDDIASKLSLVNKIIRNGYDSTFNTIESCYKDYCQSIKNVNYFQLKEQLMTQLTPLVHS